MVELAHHRNRLLCSWQASGATKSGGGFICGGWIGFYFYPAPVMFSLQEQIGCGEV